MAENVEETRESEEVLSEKAKAAIAKATKIGEAIAKKFPKHTLYVRRTDLGDDAGFVEIALRPENGGYNQEIHTAYSDEYFLNAVGEEQNARAKRIYHDFKIHFGIAD